MQRTGLYPLSTFTAVGQFLQRLENAGINPQDFIQQGIDNTMFRKQLVKAYRQVKPTVLIGVPDEPHNVERLLVLLFGIHIRNDEESRRYLSNWPRRLQEVLEENEQNKAELNRLMDVYRVHQNFTDLFDALDERSISVIVTSLGLDDGMPKTLKFTGEAHGISGQQAADIQNKAFMRMRRTVDEAARNERLAPDNILSAPIEDIILSERTRNPLRRSRIYTIGDLLGKTEDNLLSITNFGEKSLEEVKSKLAELGLYLMQ